MYGEANGLGEYYHGKNILLQFPKEGQSMPQPSGLCKEEQQGLVRRQKK